MRRGNKCKSKEETRKREGTYKIRDKEITKIILKIIILNKIKTRKRKDELKEKLIKNNN